MRVWRKKQREWVEIPDGPTEEEEAQMEYYKKHDAEPRMRHMHDNRPQYMRDLGNEHGF